MRCTNPWLPIRAPDQPDTSTTARLVARRSRQPTRPHRNQWWRREDRRSLFQFQGETSWKCSFPYYERRSWGRRCNSTWSGSVYPPRRARRASTCSPQNFFLQISDDLPATAQLIEMETQVAHGSGLYWRLRRHSRPRRGTDHDSKPLLSLPGFCVPVHPLEHRQKEHQVAVGPRKGSVAVWRSVTTKSPNGALSSSLCGDFSFSFCTLSGA